MNYLKPSGISWTVHCVLFSLMCAALVLSLQPAAPQKRWCVWLTWQVLARRPGLKETAHQRSSGSRSGNLAGVSGPWSTERHQRGLQELRQNHPERQRSRTLRVRGCTGAHIATRACARNFVECCWSDGVQSSCFSLIPFLIPGTHLQVDEE